MHVIEESDIPATDVLHHQRNAVRPIGCGEQVYMVRHQSVRMQGATVAFRRVAEVAQVKMSVAVADEASPAVVAALDDMKRNARKR
jgi:hypothetical protein